MEGSKFTIWVFGVHHTAGTSHYNPLQVTESAKFWMVLAHFNLWMYLYNNVLYYTLEFVIDVTPLICSKLFICRCLCFSPVSTPVCYRLCSPCPLCKITVCQFS